MRLIDADERIRFINMGQMRSPYEKSFSDSEVVDMLETAPTIDAVEVVRCKDCVCFRTDEKKITYCSSMGVQMEPGDFCSYGERSR